MRVCRVCVDVGVQSKLSSLGEKMDLVDRTDVSINSRIGARLRMPRSANGRRAKAKAPLSARTTTTTTFLVCIVHMRGIIIVTVAAELFTSP